MNHAFDDQMLIPHAEAFKEIQQKQRHADTSIHGERAIRGM
ncbi:hypothetical protein [Pseudodesulfovibrio alkaliphilus]|nr:hypothetical protein [Pseudodesulfovibrio alkaliphilus]